jgi:puromycin-sensitive aminopeptidase
VKIEDSIDNPYRLPRTIVPAGYRLHLTPDLEAATFAGRVEIDAVASGDAAEVVLNAAELRITSATVNGMTVATRLDEGTERLFLEAAVATGPVTIALEFTGTLNDKLRGWYRSTYVGDDGQQHTIATTQMQATDCRRAFPCFDEPDFKATFDVTLAVDPQLMAVANGAEISRTRRDDGLDDVRFATTMPMSTYLVAFVVGRLEASRTVDVDGIPLRVIHVPGKGHLAEFGLDLGAFSIRWLQSYYGIPYPTDKCDMLALPDFAAGAMENLGCITYRENLLLADTSAATQVELQTIADVVTHEMAHMWFGDLVTMKWWNGIWLNEAFATFMEILACDAYRPEWKRWTSFSLERTMAFDVDSLASTRPVEYPVYAPADCDGMFDVLTYQKGGSVLRMLQQYLGEEEFRNGVGVYLRRHALGNTETSDLWDALEEANPGTPVRRMMDSWIWQPGYPLISARLDGTTLTLAQQRFAYGDTEDATVFVVPVHLRIGGNDTKVLLDSDSMSIELSAADAQLPIVVNSGGHGFMRVDYADELRARLVGDTLASLTIIDRYNLVDDAWNATIAGRLAAADLIAFIEGFSAERDVAVWQMIGNALRGAGRLLVGDAYRAYQRRVADFVRPVLADLGLQPRAGEDALTAKLRGNLLSLLAVLGNDAAAQAECRTILADSASADPELVAAATAGVAAVGTDDDYDAYLTSFRTAATPQEQLRYLYALASFPTLDQIRRTIELAFSGEVRSQNAPFLLNMCIANREHGLVAWTSVRQRWAEANEKFPNSTIARMIDPVKMLTTPEVVSDVQSFFAEHPIPQAGKSLDQILERQRVNAALRQREESRFSAELLA